MEGEHGGLGDERATDVDVRVNFCQGERYVPEHLQCKEKCEGMSVAHSPLHGNTHENADCENEGDSENTGQCSGSGGMRDEGERGYRATENQSAKQARGAFASPTHSWILYAGRART
jgi:hypothetical protein